MDKIGTSHISFPDVLICGGALLLIVYLRRLPWNSIWSQAVALLCGCAIIATIAFLILADDLSHNAVFELAWVALALCLSLWKWNMERDRTSVAKDASVSDPLS